MRNCEAIDPLVTPYIDGQLAADQRQAVDAHVSACPSCHSRVAAERAVRDLIRARQPQLRACCAPPSLARRCAAQAGTSAVSHAPVDGGPAPRVMRDQSVPGWRGRFAPLAAAASLTLIVGSAFVYQLTASSNRVMAMELAADHLKCFGVLNPVLHTHEDAATVESAMASWFDWKMQLPGGAQQAGLELVGSRPCLYGEGKIAHIMYRHNGAPVSLFMLPRTTRTQELVQALGHQAKIWCAGDRTFVLVAREPRAEVERIATAVQASLR